MMCELDTAYKKGSPQVIESASLPGGEFAEIMCVSSPRLALELQAQPVPWLQMSFIAVEIWKSFWGMFNWLSLISFILANFQFSSWIFSFPVGLAKLFFPSLSEEATAILHVFWVYAKRFPFSSNSPHSLSKPPRQISLNALLTPTVSAHSHIYTKNPRPELSPPILISPPAFAPWLSRRTGEKKSVLIWQSEQPFHRASQRSVPVPEWELLISPGRLGCWRRLGSPGTEGLRRGGGCRSQGSGQGSAGGR